MSITLPIVDLSAAVVGTTSTVSWAAQAGGQQSQATNNNPARLWLFNESACGLQLNFQTGEQPFLPAGGWLPVVLQPNCMQYVYTVTYLMAGPQVTDLITVWFAPGEQVPEMPRLGNSPIGGTVGNVNAQFLQGVGQSLSLTEDDSGGVASLAPGSTTANAGIDFMVNDSGGNRLIVFSIDNSTGIGALGILSPVVMGSSSKIIQYAGETTAGKGVPYTVAAYGPTVVTATTQQTIIDYAPLANGMYRANFGVAINNGTSGQIILASVNYTAQAAGGAHRFQAIQSAATTLVVLDGTNSRTNGDYACQSYTFYATTGGHIQILYRDQGGTPSDTVVASIERLI